MRRRDDSAAGIADRGRTRIGHQRDAHALLQAPEHLLRGLDFVMRVGREDVRADSEVGQ
jgi:hypothetical protein